MRLAAYRALIWEEWRAHRWSLALVVAVAWFVGLVAGRVLPRIRPDIESGVVCDVGGALMIVCAFAMVVALVFPREPTMGGPANDPPRRMFRLPITTFRLAATLGLYRLAVLAVMCAGIAGIHYLYLGPSTRVGYLPLVCGTLLAFIPIQALTWVCGGSVARMGVIGFGAWLIAGAYGVLRAFEEQKHYRLLESVRVIAHAVSAHPLLSLFVCAGLACPVAVAAVAWNRRVMWRMLSSEEDTPPELVLRLVRRRGAARSPLDALVWREWREYGWIMPICGGSISLGLATLVGTYWLSGINPDPVMPTVHLVAFGMLLFCGGGTAVIAGLSPFRSAAHLNSEKQMARLPVSTTLLARARLRVVASSVALAFLVTALPVVLVQAAAASSLNTMPWKTDYVSAAVELWGLDRPVSLVAGVEGAILGLWMVCFAISRLNLAIVVMAVVPSVLVGIGGLMWDYSNDLDLALMHVWWIYLAAVCALGAILSFLRAYDKRLITRRTCIVAFGLWLAEAAPFLLLSKTSPGDPLYWVFITGLFALSVAPLATVPLAIHRRRHDQTGHETLRGQLRKL